MARYFANPRGRASPAGLATAVTSALVVSFSPGRADPASPEDTASSDAVEAQLQTDFPTVGASAVATFAALHFAIPGGRGSPTDFPTAVAAEMIVSFTPGPGGPASPEDTANSDSVEALCFAVPGCCNGLTCRTRDPRPKRPSFTRRPCELNGLLHDALGNALHGAILGHLKDLFLQVQDILPVLLVLLRSEEGPHLRPFPCTLATASVPKRVKRPPAHHAEATRIQRHRWTAKRRTRGNSESTYYHGQLFPTLLHSSHKNLQLMSQCLNFNGFPLLDQLTDIMIETNAFTPSSGGIAENNWEANKAL